MWFKIRCGIIMSIIIIAMFLARDISKPLWENGYDMTYENNIEDKSISVGAFGGEKESHEVEIRKDRLLAFKEILNIVSEGMVPLIMYLLSVICLTDLIKNTYNKFIHEEDLLDKTIYILFIIGQMSLIGLISYYVMTLSFEVLIIWLFLTISIIGLLFIGPSILEGKKTYR